MTFHRNHWRMIMQKSLFLYVGLIVLLVQASSAQWRQINVPNSGEVWALGVKGSNILAGTIHNGVFRLINNGTSWKAVGSGLRNNSVLCFAVDGNNIFAGTRDNGVFLTTNNGANWTAVNNGLTNTAILSLAVSGSLHLRRYSWGWCLSFHQQWHKLDLYLYWSSRSKN